MESTTTDGMAAVLAAHAGSAEDALAAAAALSGMDLEGLPLIESAGWLRSLDAELIRIAGDAAHPDLWPIVAAVRQLAAQRLSVLLGEDRVFLDGSDLVGQLGLSGPEEFGGWVESQASIVQDFTSAWVPEANLSERQAGATIGMEDGGVAYGFAVAFPMLESQLVHEIAGTAELAVASCRASFVLDWAQSGDMWGDAPDASLIRTAGSLDWGSDYDDLLVLLEVADQLGIPRPEGLEEEREVDPVTMTRLQDLLIAALGLPEPEPAEPGPEERPEAPGDGEPGSGRPAAIGPTAVGGWD